MRAPHTLVTKRVTRKEYQPAMTDQLRRPQALPGRGPLAGQWPGPAQAPPQAALGQIRQLLFSSIPDTAMAHSYHVQALMDPAFRDNPEFQRFSEAELNELHHQVAALGCLYRMQQGDPQAVTCLAANLQGFLDNRRLSMQLEQQLPAAIRQAPSVQMMMRHIQQTQQAVQRNMPAIQQFEAAVQAPNPGPMLVGSRPGAPIPY